MGLLGGLKMGGTLAGHCTGSGPSYVDVLLTSYVTTVVDIDVKSNQIKLV